MGARLFACLFFLLLAGCASSKVDQMELDFDRVLFERLGRFVEQADSGKITEADLAQYARTIHRLYEMQQLRLKLEREQ